MQSDNSFLVNGEKKITIKKLCAAIGVPVPAQLKKIENKVNNNVTASPRRIKPGGIYFLLLGNVNVKKQLNDALDKGAVAIFAERKEFEKFGLNEKKYPVVLVDNKIHLSRAYAALSREYHAKKICIAGKSGKTITKRLLKDIFDNTFNIVTSSDNATSYLAVANNIMTKLNDEAEIFIQELDSKTGVVKKSARLLRPDICVILNSRDYHKSKIDAEARKELFEDLNNLDKYANTGGVIVINNDDDEIAANVFKHNIISIGKDAKEKLNYRAVNIKQNREYLEFDILIDDSYRKAQHIRINGIGENMVYNTLAAFAVAKYFHMNSSSIARVIEKYKGKDTNGYFRNIGGRYIYLSDDNVDEDTLSDIKLISDNILLGSDGTPFIIIGEHKSDENDGSVIEELKREAAERNLENLFFLKNDDDAQLDKMKTVLKTKMNVGDLLVFRGDFETNISLLCDDVLGTSISKELELYTVERINDDGIMFQMIPQLGKGEIISVNQETVGESYKVPEYVDETPVYKLGRHLYKDNNKISQIEFGNNLQSIGIGCFFNCSNIEELNIPSNIKIIENGAFRNCQSLNKVVIQEGVIHIGNNVFRGCDNLTEVHLPRSLGYIGENVFRECYNLKIYCYDNSVAYKYAQEQGLNVEVFAE